MNEKEGIKLKENKLLKYMLRSLSLLIFLGVIISIFFVKNPIVKKINVNQMGTIGLEQMVSKQNPYLQISGMNLEYTGFYAIDKNDQVCSYYYFSKIGESYYFVEITKETFDQLGAQLEKPLEDVSLKAKIVINNDVVEIAAAKEEMAVADYMETFKIGQFVMSEQDNDLEKILIYYGLAIMLAVGLLILSLMTKTDRRDL